MSDLSEAIMSNNITLQTEHYGLQVLQYTHNGAMKKVADITPKGDIEPTCVVPEVNPLLTALVKRIANIFSMAKGNYYAAEMDHVRRACDKVEFRNE